MNWVRIALHASGLSALVLVWHQFYEEQAQVKNADEWCTVCIKTMLHVPLVNLHLLFFFGLTFKFWLYVYDYW